MKISELEENNHIYYLGNELDRLFAKLIDLLPFFLVIYLLIHNVILSFLFSILFVIFLGTITEHLWGNTLGKKIFKIKILDDYGNYPKLLLSLKRNILCLINLFPNFTDQLDRTGIQITRMHFSMHLNNKFCKTYILKENKINEIHRLLNSKIKDK